MELTTALAEAFDHATLIVGGVDPDRIDGPTPCRDWDCETLLVHTFGVMANIGRGVRGEPLADPNAYALDADLRAQFRNEADSTLAAWQARGLDGLVDIGAGPMPATVAITVNLLDTSAHSWDIARATAQDGQFPQPLAETLLTVATGFMTDDLRQGVGFDPPIALSDDADATDRFVAFLGRQP
jgi:uncharacterized protein (TIGR03086 family)